MAKLVLLFTVLPFVELYLLVLIGERIGAWPTVGIVVASGVAGALLARRAGLRVVRSWRDALAQGRAPESSVVEGLLALLGAALLVVPGVISDVAGVVLLVPPTRKIVAGRLQKRVASRFHLRPMPRSADRRPARDQTIDVEGRTVDEKPIEPPDEER
ncbi:MAG: FxsA family protein [Myxococcales bacterium]